LSEESLSSPGASTQIAVFQLPDSFDYDVLVEEAERTLEESDVSVAEDLSTAAHTVTGYDADALPPLSPSSPETTATATPTRRLSYHHWKRKASRVGKRKAEEGLKQEDYTPSTRTVEQALKPAKVLRLETDAANFNAAKGAHTGKRGTKEEYGTKEEVEREWTLEELVALGYIHIPWDGIHPLLIVDCKGRIVAFLAGRPNRKDFEEEMMELFDIMMAESEKMGWLEDWKEAHKRGFFPAFNTGVTMGMGSPTPVALRNGKAVDGVLNRLLSLPALKRLSSYHNSTVKLWEPRMHAAYRATVESMHRHLPRLPRNFTNNIFTAAAFNFGGRVRTIQHRDHMNWPFGLCVITAMGRFNAKQSAHLVLKEFKIVTDFPHASTAAIPSACCTHFNTRLAPGETRMSFTQYTAGAIFRWVENGYRTEKSIKESSSREWSAIQEKKKAAVAERLKMYSNITELLVPIENVDVKARLLRPFISKEKLDEANARVKILESQMHG
ncbi:hypothetical protein V5O48_017751, partial [Marasmius crinis-equi]